MAASPGEEEKGGKMASHAAKPPLNGIQCGGSGVLDRPGGTGAHSYPLGGMNVCTWVWKGAEFFN